MSQVGADTPIFVRNDKTVTMSRRSLLMGLATGSVVAMAPGCTTNPYTGASQFIVVSDAQLAQLSQATWQQALQQERVSRDRNLRNRVNSVGQRMTRVSPVANMDWEYVVFDEPTVNAWVLPNGKVAFYRGILDIMENDDQIATVMGHEIGHITGRHSAERASQQMAAGLALTATAVALDMADVENAALWAGVLGAGVTFGVILPYSRRHENEADRLGVDLMARSGYRTREAVRFWEIMNQRGGSRTFEFASTHPSGPNRQRDIQNYINQMGYA